MGQTSWSPKAYTSVSAARSTMSREEIFTQRKIREDFNPSNIAIRESCDSEAHPESNAIIIARQNRVAGWSLDALFCLISGFPN